MSALEMAVAILITPVSAFLIAWWVLRENRKIGDAARRRAETVKH